MMTTATATPKQDKATRATASLLPPAKQVSTCVGDLAVRDTGQVGPVGQTIVLWPSILADYRIYRHQVQAWKGRHRIIAIDGPDHGESGRSAGSFSIHDCGQALGQVLDTAHISVVNDLPGVTLVIDDFLQRHTQFLKEHPS